MTKKDLINENKRLKEVIKEFSDDCDLCSRCPYNVSDYATPSEIDDSDYNCEQTANASNCLSVVLEYKYGVKL